MAVMKGQSIAQSANRTVQTNFHRINYRNDYGYLEQN